MKKFSFVLLLVALAAMPAGCSRKTPSAKTKGAKAAKNAASRVDRNDEAIEEDELAIERHAEEAKRTIDAITAEAEDALKKTRENAKARANRHAQELSEFAAELAEEAKDRAEDIPEAIDRAIQRQADRRPGTHPRRPAAKDLDEERTSDDESEE